MNPFRRNAGAGAASAAAVLPVVWLPESEPAVGDKLPAAAGGVVGALGAKRDETFDRLSRMFRGAGSDVTTQALFRAIVEYRVDSLEKRE